VRRERPAGDRRAVPLRGALLPVVLGLLSGCATLFPRAPAGPGRAARPAAAPVESGEKPGRPPSTPGSVAPGRGAESHPGELADADKPEWMRGLARPDFTTLPLRWSPRVSRFLEQYKNEPRYREIIRSWVRRLPAYRPTMERIFERHGLPRGLVFVSMIESGFIPGAVSSARAGGFWQFLPDVARGYGLEVSFWVDERRDPEKSTEAAALYLADLNARFGSWELALAGYNAGVYAILASIQRYNSNDYLTLCQIESGLPWETTEYVPKVLAVAIVERNQAAFGIDDVIPDPPRRFELVQVGGGVSFDAMAARLGVSADEIAQLNPAYPRRRTPPDRGAIALRVPEGRARPLGDLGRGDLVMVRVRPGETLRGLARAYRLPREKLRQINGINDESDVTAGTVLFVPRTAKRAAVPAGKPAAKTVPVKSAPTKK
jgi:membrane-bound lytic murein transglycosylase D